MNNVDSIKMRLYRRGLSPFVGPTYTGHTNPAKCMLELLQTVHGSEAINYPSFEMVAAQLEGTIPSEVIADGFIIGNGHLSVEEGANKLCEIGDFFIYTDENGLISLCANEELK
jgi:hypothetical protein